MKDSFETSIKELELIVARLEKGDASLDETLKMFEQGIKLTIACQKILDDAEQKVTVLMKNADGEIVEKPLDSEEE